VNDSARARLRDLAGQRLGFATSALPDTRVDEALRALHDTPLEHLAALPIEGPQWQAVIGALTIGETNFFRQPAWFAQLERQVLGPVIARRSVAGPKRLRLWSAGCATGEEAYSLAILVLRLLHDRSGWEISILGTDLCAAFIAEARRAQYREWSLREVDEFARQQHFRRLDSGRFELLPATRNLVTFELLNLAGNEPWNDPRLADLDLIVCRNVLMYLAPQHQRSVAQRLIGRLGADGWLATAPAEATAEWFRPLTPVNVPSAVLFHRTPPAGEAPRVEEPANAPRIRTHAAPARRPVREGPRTGRALPPIPRTAPVDDLEHVLHERALALAAPLAAAPDVDARELVVFRAGSERYAIDAVDIEEAIEVTEVTPLPGLPPFYRGLIIHQGVVYSLIDIRPLTGAPAGDEFVPAHAILFLSDERAVAIAAESLESFVRTDPAAIASEGIALLDVHRLLGDARLVIDDRVTGV
jgi:chemotaxis methyl-accepting protein methylase/chemotaxis signal transduction protein